MSNFQIGNIIRTDKGIGRIVAIDAYGWIGAEYDKPTGADHDCGGAGRKGYCWWVSPKVSKIELLAGAPPVKATTFKKGSQCDRILKYLLAGHSITPLKARQLFNAERLAARILEIRQAGHKVKATIKADLNGKTYAEYSLRKVDRFGNAA